LYDFLYGGTYYWPPSSAQTKTGPKENKQSSLTFRKKKKASPNS
jgi:hypothetical protein